MGNPELSEGLNIRCKEPSTFTLLFRSGKILRNRMLADEREHSTALRSR